MKKYKPQLELTEAVLLSREWMVTNGTGSYAAGTVSGVLTRSYHGLLVRAMEPPLGRTVQLVKLDETARAGGAAYPLFDNRWQGASTALEPGGSKRIADFYLEGSTPVWVYAFDGQVLEKRVWMQPGEDSVYVRYDRVAGEGELGLEVRAFANHRSFHQLIRGDGRRFSVDRVDGGLRIAVSGSAPFFLFARGAAIRPEQTWHRDYFHALEAYRGLDSLGDNLLAGVLRWNLPPGGTVLIVASARPDASLEGDGVLRGRREYERNLLRIANVDHSDFRIEQLVLAADQFIVRREVHRRKVEGRSVIAGYPWFGDWGRDTMIALPGLALSTGRPEIARSILQTFAEFIDRGMLPNRFPDEGESPEYNTADATLWFFEALRAYHDAAGDTALLEDIYPRLADILAWHIEGTRYGIHMDPVDSLLFAGQPGVQLTWMDARVGDWVVTPRTGKAVEINALWYSALRNMQHFSDVLGRKGQLYAKLAGAVAESFGRFWNPQRQALFDVLDVPGTGTDSSMRPNQIFAVSLSHSPLETELQKAVVDACLREFLTPRGLRSLAAGHPDYHGVYGGDQASRDGAYHQGTVWGWLIGPLAVAHYRAYGDRETARSLLLPLLDAMAEHGVGTISEVYDGDPPHAPRGCFAQAWSVAEVLRAWDVITRRDPGRPASDPVR